MKRLIKTFLIIFALMSFSFGFLNLNKKTASAVFEAGTFSKPIIGIEIEPGGSGGSSSEGYYTINNPAALVWFASQVSINSTISAKLVANIDLGGKIWSPIGLSSQTAYKGTFLGNGYSIQNMIIDTTISTQNAGLFYALDSGAIVQDIAFENPVIISNGVNIGAVAGTMKNDAIIRNISVSGGMLKYNGSGTGYVGGLVGRALNSSANLFINNSFSTSTLSGLSTNSYVGGIVGYGESQHAVITNTYYDGRMYIGSTSRYNGIINQYSSSLKNAYYAVSYATSEGATSFTERYGYRSSSGTLTTLASTSTRANFIEVFNTNEKLNNIFNSSSSDVLLKAEENWFVQSTNLNYLLPQLRGVGNKYVAIKQEYGTADLIQTHNNSYITKKFIFKEQVTFNSANNLNLNFYLRLSDFAAGDLISKSIYSLRKISGQSTTNYTTDTEAQTFLKEDVNTDRLNTQNMIISNTSSGERQGNYIYAFTLQDRLYEHTITVYNKAVYDNVINKSDSKVTSATVNLLKESAAGELFLTTTGTAVQQNVWTNISYDYTKTNYFYTTSATSIKINADGGLHFHTQTIGGTGFSTLTPNKTITSTASKATINMFVSDLFELVYPIQQEALQKVFFGTQDYGRQYSKPSSSVFLSYYSLKSYQLSSNNYIEMSTPYYTSMSNPGYNFNGWYSSNASDAIRFSDNNSNFLQNANSSVQTAAKLLLNNYLVSSQELDKNGTAMIYKTSSPLEMYGKWNAKNIEVRIESYLYLNEFNFLSIDDTEMVEAFKNPNNRMSLNTVNEESKVHLQTTNYNANTNYAVIPNATTTGNSITLERASEGYGYGLRAFLVYGKLNGIDNGNLTPATFNANYTGGNSNYFYVFGSLSDLTKSVVLNHLHGDIVIIALYERGEGTISINYNLEIPQGATETGLQFGYSVIEMNGVTIRTGTITQNNSVIQNLKAGQRVQILKNSMIIQPEFTFSAFSDAQRFVSDDNFNETIGYDGTTYTFSNFAEALGIGTALSNSNYELNYNVGVRYSGFTMQFLTGYYEGANITQLPNTAEYPNLIVTKTLGNLENPIISLNTVRNITNLTSLDIVINNQTLFEKYGLDLLILKDDEVVSGVNYSFDKVSNAYVISNFAGFDESASYKTYLIMTKTVYEVEITVQNASNQASAQIMKQGQSWQEIVWNVNTYNFNVYFDELNTLSFYAQEGYKIQSLTVMGNPPQGFVVDSQSFEDYSLKLNVLKPSGDIPNKKVNIIFNVAPRVQEYIIEYYYESLDGLSYQKFDGQDKIKSGLVGNVGEVIGLDIKNFNGFSYISSPETESGLITYDTSAAKDNTLKLKVYYTRNTYTIIYSANSDSPNPNSQDQKYEKQINVADGTVLTKTGYDFVKWSTSITGNGGLDYNSNQQITLNDEFISYANVNNQISLYGFWENRTTEITFDKQSGTGGTNSVVATYDLQMPTANAPTRTGYDFAGYFDDINGQGKQYYSSTMLSLSFWDKDVSNSTLYAHWTAKQITVRFSENLSGVTFNYNTKILNLNSYFEDADTLSGLNAGFPDITFTMSPVVYELKGWSLGATPASSLILPNTQITSYVAEIFVYAHWSVLAPIVTTPANWQVTKAFTGNQIETLTVMSTTSETNAYIANFNTGAGIVYSYAWQKDGVAVAGQTSNILRLTNVSESGAYSLVVTARHNNNLWGSEVSNTVFGQVTITRMQIDVLAYMESNFVTKVYDGNRNVRNATTSNLSILVVTSALYDTADVGQNKAATFNLSFTSGKIPGNYNIVYKGGSYNQSNQVFFIIDNFARITQYNLGISFPDKTFEENGTKPKVFVSDFVISAQDNAFLSQIGQKIALTSYVESPSSAQGEYSNQALNTFIIIENDVNADKTSNYNITVTGKIIIIERLNTKLLIIDKKAILNKETQIETNVSTAPFAIFYGATDISTSKTVGEYYFDVLNTTSNQILITVDQDFEGNIRFVAGSFTHVVGVTTTQALAHKWIESGKGDVNGSTLIYDFSTLSAGGESLVTVRYLNYSTISYNIRISETPFKVERVYNTAAGIGITHPTNAELNKKGLSLVGWYTSTDESQVASTNWKGIGEIQLYAKWNLETPEVNLLKDGAPFTNSIEQIYDGLSHVVSTVIPNSDVYISYSYTWQTSTVSNATTFTFKDHRIDQSVKITVKADLLIGGQLYQTINSETKEFFITVNKFNYDYSTVITKVYDGTTTIKSELGNYILVDINLGTVTEKVRIVGNYQTVNGETNPILASAAGTNKKLDANFQAEGSTNLNNYNFTLSSTGTITQLELKNVDIGAKEDNNKIYNGTVLQLTKENVTSTTLLSGDVLTLTFQTVAASVAVYDAGVNQIVITNWTVYSGGENVTNNYFIGSIIGQAQITNYQLLTDNIVFNSKEIVYDGNPKDTIMLADFSAMPNGALPADVTAVYTWRSSINPTIYDYDDFAPSQVGVYLFTLTIYADANNYTIVGGNPLLANLTITPKTIVHDITNIAIEGHKIFTVNVNRVLDNGHVLFGTVENNSDLPGIYSVANSNLNISLTIRNQAEQDQTSNYIIIINGSITIVHYFTIVYHANNNEPEESTPTQQVNYGEESIIYTNMFTKDGYVFSSWNTAPLGTGDEYLPNQGYQIVREHGSIIDLYAIWTPGENTRYYIEYYLQDLQLNYPSSASFTDVFYQTTENIVNLSPNLNSINPSKIDNFNLTITNPNNGNSIVINDIFNKTFTGFTATVHANNLLSGEITPSQNSLVLRIYFSRNSYTLTLKNNNGDMDTVNSYLYQQEISTPTQPTRSGYQFNNWFGNYPSPEQYVIVWPFSMPAANTTLWAVYIRNPDTAFVVETYLQNVDKSYPAVANSVLNRAGETDTFAIIETITNAGRITQAVLKIYEDASLEDFIRDNYTLPVTYQGYFMVSYASQVLSGYLTSPQSLVLRIYYQREEYTLTKEIHNDVNSIQTSVHVYQETLPRPATPQYTGYVFDGWYLNYNTETGVYSSLMSWPFQIVEDVTIHAKWNPSENTAYTVNIFFETVAETYSAVPSQTSVFTSTTNFFAEVTNEGLDKVIKIYQDDTKVVTDSTLFGFDFEGFVVREDLSDLTTYIYPDGSGVINIYYERVGNLRVTFDHKNGTTTYSEFVKFEQTINAPEEPEYLGYVFVGWYFDEQAENQPVSWPYSVKNNTTTMYARWIGATGIQYKLAIYKETDSGVWQSTPSIEIFEGVTDEWVAVEQINGVWTLVVYQDDTKLIEIEQVKELEIVGYTYTINGQTIEKAILNDGSTTITLYYTLNSYTFTTIKNNGEEPVVESVLYSKKPLNIVNPTKIGYVFDRWFRDIMFVTPFNQETFEMPANNVTIYAKWTAATNTEYKIEYYLEELNDTYSETPFFVFDGQGTTDYYIEISGTNIITYTTPAKTNVVKTEALASYTGFTKVTGIAAEILSGSILPNGTQVLKVYFDRNEHSITFNFNNGDAPVTITNIKYQQEVVRTIPTKLGYDFSDWYHEIGLITKSNWNINIAQNEMTYVMESRDIELYAKWEARADTKYNVQHYLQNADDNDFVLYETKEYQGQTDTTANATILGYAGLSFDELNASNILSGNIEADGSLVLRVYYARNIYNIIFNGNGSTSGSMDDMAFKYGQTLALANNEFIRDGFNFLGWTEEEGSLLIQKINMANFTFNKTQNITLYALWQIMPIEDLILVNNNENIIYYGDSITLSANLNHLANATVSYEWFRNNVKISNTQQTLNITELSQSGVYKVRVRIEANNLTGVQIKSATGETDTLEIEVRQRIIFVEFGQTDLTYNASSQMPTYQVKFFTDAEIGLPTRPNIVIPSSTYKLFSSNVEVSQTTNNGTYEIEVFVQENSNFVVTGTTRQTYNIQKLEWDISSLIKQGEFEKEYGVPANPDPLLQKTLQNPTTFEEVTVYFARQVGQTMGVYDLTLAAIESNNNNYTIILNADNNGFIIKSSTSGVAYISFANLSLLTKVYDGQSIDVLSSSAFNISNLTILPNATIVDAQFEIRNSTKNVGTYEILLVSATTLEFANVELSSSYYFTITPIQIDLVPTSISKVYDGLINYNGIQFANVLPQDQANIQILGTYQSANVGNNINVSVALQGSERTNYTLSSAFTNLKGEIVARKVKVITQTGLSFVYGTFTNLDTLTYEVYAENLQQNGVYDQAADISQITGVLALNPVDSKFGVQVYSIELGTLTSSSNYIIEEFEGGTLEITQKQVQVIADWNKFYDGTTSFAKEIMIIGVLQGDDVVASAVYASAEIGTGITISVTLSGADAGNYYLQNSVVIGNIENRFVTAELDYGFDNIDSPQHSVPTELSMTLVYNRTILQSGYYMPVPTAVGYIFIGWFDDVVAGNQYTENTLIDSSIWNENVLTRVLYARWSEGQVDLNVDVVTYSSTYYIVEDMGAPSLVGGTFTINSISYENGSNSQTVNFKQNSIIVATPNADYDFDGFYLSTSLSAPMLTTNPSMTIVDNMLTINMQDHTQIYIRFKLKTAVLTLDVNSATTEVTTSQEFMAWNVTYNANNHISKMEEEFDYNTVVTLPTLAQMNRIGYVFLGWWTDANPQETDVLLTEVTISQTQTLYAIWEANTFTATFVANTGNENLTDLNADNGRFENPTNPSDIGIFEKQVSFESLIGEIEMPTRAKYTFAGWYDNPEFDGIVYTEISEYNFNENKTFYARWNVKVITAVISVAQFAGGEITVEQTSGVLSVFKQTIGSNQLITISLIATTTLRVSVIENQGSKLALSTEFINGVDFNLISNTNANSTQVTVSHFANNFTLTFMFKVELHEVTITVNNSNFGLVGVVVENIANESLRDEFRDDNAIVVDNSVGQQQILTVYVYTTEIVRIELQIVLGYQLSNIVIEVGSGDLSTIVNNIVRFSEFKQDASISINYTEKVNTIAVRAGFDVTLSQQNVNMGTFAISIENSLGQTILVNDNAQFNNANSNIQIKTGEILILTVTNKHGFAISQEIADYLFVKEGIQYENGVFDLTEIENGIIKFSGFNSNGDIVLPFERLLFALDIKIALLENGIFTEITNNTNYYATPAFVTVYDYFENDIGYFIYQKQIQAQAQVQYGYVIDGWYTDLTQASKVDSDENLNGYIITNNSSIFVVVQRDIFKVSYEVLGMGEIQGASTTQFVPFLLSAEEVTATPFAGYQFEKWQIYNENTSEWLDDISKILPSRQDGSITSNLLIRAVFIASPIEITFNSEYILYRAPNGTYIYSENMNENIGTLQIYGEEISGIEFTYLTQTDNAVRVIAQPKEGYIISEWLVIQNSSIRIEYNDGLLDITITGFTANFTITALFEAKQNIFELAVVRTQQPNYNFTTADYVEGGMIEIDPSLYLTTQSYLPLVRANVRTEQNFDVTYVILKGYKLVYSETDPTKALIAIRYEDSNQLIFIEDMTINTLIGNYVSEVTFNISGFTKGGTIVVFVEEEIFEVTFHKTSTESAVYNLKINSAFGEVGSDYRLPTRAGYIFKGWFSAPSGNGTQYIDSNGVVLVEWNINHLNIYANWERAFVRYDIQIVPSTGVITGSFEWKVGEGVLKQRLNNFTYEYYVDNLVYFVAQQGVDGYQFSHWEKDGQIVSQNRLYAFSIDELETQFNQTLTIVYSVRVSVQATLGGMATVDEQNFVYLLEGQEATVQSFEQPGYEFVGWRVRGTTTIISQETTFVVPYSTSAIVYEAVFIGRKVEIRFTNAPDGGLIQDMLIDGESAVLEDGKYYARLNQQIVFVVDVEAGYYLYGWLKNGVRISPFDYYELTITDIDLAFIEFAPEFILRQITYDIVFANEGKIRVNNADILSGTGYVTNYYETISFRVIPNIRYEYKEIRLVKNSVISVIEQQYIVKNGLEYVVTIPANMLGFSGLNRITIIFEKSYWLDSKQVFQGLGTENNPYLIISAENFAQMAYLINENIAVDSNDKVDYANAYYLMSGTVDFEEKFWVPIGTQENPFNGVIKLTYQRKNIFLDRAYVVTRYDGLFGYTTESAEFIMDGSDITTGIIIISSVTTGLLGIASAFAISIYTKRKRLRLQSSIFPTERPMKKK